MDNIIPLPGTTSRRYEVEIIAPKSYDTLTQAVQALLERKVVVLKLEQLDQDQAQRLLDFLSGSAYAISAQVSQISESVFLFASQGIQIQDRNIG